ncbi:MAG: hypothetical protein CMH98_18365 [Oceanospirillaceae bacterium]|nr:hypothetical protein [Oceanospirillaceae bacterium]
MGVATIYSVPACSLEAEVMRGKLPEPWLRGKLRGICLLLGAAAIGLSGCSTTPQTGQSGFSETSVSQGNAQLFQQIHDALDAGEFGNAGLQLQLLREQPLEGADRVEYLLLSARLHILQHQPELAAAYFTQLNDGMSAATAEQELRISLLRAAWYESKGEYLSAARERDFLSGALEGERYDQNHARIWQDLMSMNELELLKWAEKIPDTQFGSWLELAAISRNPRLTLDEHLAAVRTWQQHNPSHPAAKKLPGGLALLEDLAEHRPTNVALLLPLTGPLEKTGAAIRDGFMAAYYESVAKGYETPDVNIYDSQLYSDPQIAYVQAQLDGAQWMVGPVNKMQVQGLQAQESLPMPTLALNYGDRSETEGTPDNLYQFGLAAEDEAEQIAEQAWTDGHRRALVMVPRGGWGERIFEAFRERWTALGGEIGEARFYPNVSDYNPEIKALLNVDDSQARYKTMRRLLRESTEFEPRRREDADWVFMVSLPQQGRMIKPALAFNFASDLPVYATSHVFSGVVNRQKDRDLNGIRFCDVPWLLETSDLHDSVERAVPNGMGGYARLYAMGVDAFRLLARIRQLEVFPYAQMFGSTGALTLDDQRRIHRRTECTIFRSGQPAQVADSD